MIKSVKKIVALCIAATMSLGVFGCGSSASTSTSSASGSASSGELKDEYVAAIGGEPNHIDPAVATDNSSVPTVELVYNPLFTLDEDGELVNTACEKMDVSDDGLTYTLKLVDGNKWSDGKDVKASDYEFGAKRSLGMGSAEASYCYFISDYIAGADGLEGKDVKDMDALGIKADDDANTLTFTLKSPCAYFKYLLTNGVFMPVRSDVAKEHDSTWSDSADIPSCGAYKLTSVQLNSEIKLEKNENFVNADKVKTQKLVIKVMEDMDAQLMAYQSGEIDAALAVDSSVVTKNYSGKDDLIKTKSVINAYVLINSASFSSAPALQDVRVRRALQLGLDRSKIIEALDAGDAYYELYGYVPKGFAGVDGDFREEADEEGQYVSYDPDKAKELLAEAGYSTENPLNLVYKYNSNNTNDTVAQVLQSEWAKIGVNLTFATEEVKVFFDDRDGQGNYELARGAMSADYMDPTTFLCMFLQSSQRKVVVADDKIESLVAEANKISDTKERLEKLHELEKYIVEEQSYTIPMYGYYQLYLVKPGTSGIGYDPVGNTNLSYVQCTK